MRVFCYVRVSTTEQALNGHSIAEQTERLQKYCDAMGWTLVKTYTDAGFSGANMERPALQEMISNITHVDKVVVYKLDRLSRSQKDTLYLIEDVFLRNGCDFVSMNENFDTATPFGRAMIGVLAVFAQLEREQIKERMTMGKDARAKQGKWRGGITPIGYEYKDGNLIVNDFSALQVKELFDLVGNGMPIRTIERLFKEKGYKNQYGTDWNTKQIRRTIHNMTYVGYIRHKDEWIKADHEPIIDKEMYDKANQVLSDRNKAFVESGFKTGILNQTTYLGGLIYCKHCGGKYSKCVIGKSLCYGCYSRHKKVKAMIKDASCKNKYYKIDELDSIVIDEIKKLQFEPVGKIANRSDKKEILEKKLQEIESQISRFLDLYGLGRFDIDSLDSKLIPLEEQRDKLKNEIKNTDFGMKSEDAWKIIKSFDDVLKIGDFNAIRSVIHALIDRIEISGDAIEIHWNFQ